MYLESVLRHPFLGLREREVSPFFLKVRVLGVRGGNAPAKDVVSVENSGSEGLHHKRSVAAEPKVPKFKKKQGKHTSLANKRGECSWWKESTIVCVYLVSKIMVEIVSDTIIFGL